MKTYITTICKKHDGTEIYNRTRVPASMAEDTLEDVLLEMLGDPIDCLEFFGSDTLVNPKFTFLNDFGEKCTLLVEQFGEAAQERTGKFRYG